MRHPYRPEIDGLRTVAVLLVILHHLGWSIMSGGYIGVDVFFVISGYLITTILVEEARAGKFSLVHFYKRRIIRLAPAYFVVLAATSTVALLFMLPAEILDYAQSVSYSTFFLANFYMWKEVGGYFGTQAEFVPQLHLWSLAVEEQFYLCWPIILFGIYKLAGRRLILPVILIFILGGIAASEYGVQHYRAAAYYLLPTRFFELMVGAAIAVMPVILKRTSPLLEIFSLAGIALILWSAATYTTERLFPGYWAVMPCVGSALVIYFSRAKQGVTGRLLAMSPMVYLGKISYPAYLWHWPIIVFLNLESIKINLFVGMGVIATTLALSGLTHRYVEISFRRMNAYGLPRVFAVGFALPAVMAMAFSFTIKTNDGFPDRFSEELNLKSAAVLSATDKARGRCNEGNSKNPLTEDECVLGVAGRPVDFLLVGDSHANHFTGMLDVMAKDAGVRGYDVTQSNTVYLPGGQRFYWQDGQLVEHVNFQIRNAKLDEMIAHNHYKAVVLAGAFPTYINGNELKMGASTEGAFEKGMRTAIQHIKNSGSRVIIVNDTPGTYDVAYDCTLLNTRFGTHNNCTVPIQKYRANFEKWNSFLIELKREFPSMVVIEPDKVICDGSICNTEIDGVPLYRDQGHLNEMGSVLIGRLYVDRLGNPLDFLHKSELDMSIH